MKKIILTLLLFVIPTQVLAYNTPTTAPKLCLYDVRPQHILQSDNYFTVSEQAIVSRYDMVASASFWTEAQKCKENNPNTIVLYKYTFGSVFPINDMEQWAIDDTLCDLQNLIRWYVKKNYENGVDWRYKDVNGNLLPLIWNMEHLNWTLNCLPGVYGKSNGLIASQYIQNVAVPQIMSSECFRNSYDGIMLDTYPTIDCWNPSWINVDYNYDTIADDCYGKLSDEQAYSSRHPWSMQKLLLTRHFFLYMYQNSPDNFLLLYGQDALPAAASFLFNGWKIENWMNQGGAATHGSKWLRWWDGEGNTTGYMEGERKFRRYGTPYDAQFDSIQGWDMSILHMYLPAQWDEIKKAKMARFGLGTTLLGDGYFAVSEQSFDSNGKEYAKFYDIHEMWDWKLKLPALGPAYTVQDKSMLPYNKNTMLFCRKYINRLTGTVCTVVVDTLRQDARLVNYNFGKPVQVIE